VPRDNAVEEDDGYLIELLTSDKDSALLVLDAKTMTEIARLTLPQRVPYGVHGCWLNSEQLQSLQA
jgi:carotenoid cleavage dioxygenase-like enzyme